MKKIISNLLVVALLMGTLLGCLSGCGGTGNEKDPESSTTIAEQPGSDPSDATSEDTSGKESESDTESETEEETEEQNVHVDYADTLKLDMNSNTLKLEVTVKAYIDGDTTHFHVPTSVLPTGVLKARYLSVNTPESTGKIEEWGKAASNFTREKLSTATSIIVESDNDKLNADSTGDRYLLWIWYKPEGSDEYRNLNIEILQNGLAIASNSANNRYGEASIAAINQARAEKLCVYSGEKDPDFFYGEAYELTLKELRCNIEQYNGSKVAFTGVITMDHENAVYVESYDEETDMWYGIYVYYGFESSTYLLEALEIGNEVRIVGTVSYYEGSGSYQVSGLSYRAMKPNDPSNTLLLSEGHSAVYLPTTPEKFATEKVNVTQIDEEGNETIKAFDYAYLALYSSISMEGLRVTHVSTTTDPTSDNYGAMTLTCVANGVTVKVRTTVFRDGNGNLITAEYFNGKTIDIKGVIEYFKGDYQIKVFSLNDIHVR